MGCSTLCEALYSAELTIDRVAIAKAAAETKEFEWAAKYDWDPFGRDCSTQLDRTGAIINSTEFASKLDSVLTSAKLKLGQGGMIYYTG